MNDGIGGIESACILLGIIRCMQGCCATVAIPSSILESRFTLIGIKMGSNVNAFGDP